MQATMKRLDTAIRGHRRLVLGAWIAVLIAAVPFAMRQSDHLTGGGFGVPGSQSQVVVDQLAHHDFPGAAQASMAAVLVPSRGATPAQFRAAVANLRRAVAQTSHVSLSAAQHERALRASTNPRDLLVGLNVDVSSSKSTDVAAALSRRLPASGPVRVGLAGQGALWAGLQKLSKADLSKAESAGFPIVLLILLVIFGSLAAASLPLALGAGSVVITGALIYALSTVTEMSVFVTNMASMIGIGVAVDYSLFVLARYREEIADGATPDDARATALSTSGLAVLFSGATVMIALAGLYLVHSTALRSMALGAILVVAVSVLAATTLLPALISLLGDRAVRRGPLLSRFFTWLRHDTRSPEARAADDKARIQFWPAWTRRVMARPWLSALGAAAVLVALALPALHLHTVDGALRQFPASNQTREDAEIATRLVGAGASSPVEVVVAPGQVAEARAVLRHDPLIAAVEPPLASRDGSRMLVEGILHTDGESDAAKTTIGRLRAQLPPGAVVGGDSAVLRDLHDQVAGSMWKIALFVLALSYLVLLVLLRSVVLPLKAVVMNLLSVGAAYGVLAMVFGHVDTITPPLVLAVVFGLSMDYEVFLLSRIRERYERTGDTVAAVAGGLESSARTISSAALIMVCVFMTFVLTGVPSIQQIGLGNAVAIAVDATIVRLVLVPATMKLLGRFNWWLPRRLDRVLPHAEPVGTPA